MPIFEKINMGAKDGDEVKKRRCKKNNTRGPVQATRQSSRVDRSMKLMEKRGSSWVMNARGVVSEEVPAYCAHPTSLVIT
jgi:riboflavin synthase